MAPCRNLQPSHHNPRLFGNGRIATTLAQSHQTTRPPWSGHPSRPTTRLNLEPLQRVTLPARQSPPRISYFLLRLQLGLICLLPRFQTYVADTAWRMYQYLPPHTPSARKCPPVSATCSDVLISTAPMNMPKLDPRNNCDQEPSCSRITARYHQDVDTQKHQLLGLAMCDCHWIRGLG